MILRNGNRISAADTEKELPDVVEYTTYARESKEFTGCTDVSYGYTIGRGCHFRRDFGNH